MVMTKIRISALLGVGLGLLPSCAVPKAALAAPPTPKSLPPVEKIPEPNVSETPALPVDEGYRMPDMLGMPSDGEFRASNPALPKLSSEAGAVISRPPMDPPSRVKSKVPAAE